MKTIALTLVLLGSSAAFACPDLSGRYNCSQDQSAGTLVVTQADADGITTYTVSHGQQQQEPLVIVADGVKHRDEDKSDDMTAVYEETYTCSQDSLVNEFSETYTDNQGQVTYQFAGSEVTSLDADKNLVSKYSDKDSDGNVTEETNTCKRM